MAEQCRTRFLMVSTVALAFAALYGCATTRVVKKQPGRGGEIMVQEGLIGDARADATKKMRENCGKRRPVITEEGEAVVGHRSSKNVHLTKWGSTSDTDTEDKREWRIKYRCR